MSETVTGQCTCNIRIDNVIILNGTLNISFHGCNPCFAQIRRRSEHDLQHYYELRIILNGKSVADPGFPIGGAWTR